MASQDELKKQVQYTRNSTFVCMPRYVKNGEIVNAKALFRSSWHHGLEGTKSCKRVGGELFGGVCGDTPKVTKLLCRISSPLHLLYKPLPS